MVAATKELISSYDEVLCLCFVVVLRRNFIFWCEEHGFDKIEEMLSLLGFQKIFFNFGFYSNFDNTFSNQRYKKQIVLLSDVMFVDPISYLVKSEVMSQTSFKARLQKENMSCISFESDIVIILFIKLKKSPNIRLKVD